MEITSINSLSIPDVKIIRFSRFTDNRGYFSEIYNKNDFSPCCDFLKNIEFKQVNESFSFANTFRGLHIQWNPAMGKMLRLVCGHLIDFALDLRIDSLTYKKIISYEVKNSNNYCDWIWIPPGFAHGVLLLDDSIIEYFCTETYNAKGEQSISILSENIDWSLCAPEVKKYFDFENIQKLNMSCRDKNSIFLSEFEVLDQAALIKKHNII